jgi:hypothetical protein
MATDREEALNNMTGAQSADTSDNNQVVDPPEVKDDAANTGAADEPKTDDREPADSPMTGKETAKLLEALTDAPAAAKPGDKPADKPAAAATDKPADAAAAAAPAAKTDAEKTLEEQEAEALEGVQSERGKARIKQTFTRLKEIDAERAELAKDMTDFKEMVQSTGLTPTEYVQMLEIGKLLKSGSEADLKVALQHVDAQRAHIVKQLGIDAPGVDPLADFPDLKTQVDNMEITKERALELAKFKRQEQTQHAQRQREQASQQDMQAFQQQIAEVAKTAETYFDSRKTEVDYPAKMAELGKKFQDPKFMQEFVSTYEPRQWFGALKLLYDATVVPQVPRQQNNPQALRSRPTNTGAPAADANAPLANKLMNTLESMGITS